MPDYASVQGILIGVVAAFVVVVTILGPENYGSHFENAKAAFEENSDELAGTSEGKDSRPTSVQEVEEKV